MDWLNAIKGNPLPWLLAEDDSCPGVRYFALTELLGLPVNDPQASAAREAVMQHGPVPAILAQQAPEGYWIQAGPGYNPKYRSMVWQVIYLAQFAADPRHEKVQRALEYLLQQHVSSLGSLSVNGAPSQAIQCLQGNLLAALIDLGRLHDPRVQLALDWLARSVTGEGLATSEDTQIARRFYRSSNCGPGFLCAANNHLPCAWGAVKTGLALGKVPEAARTPEIQRAIDQTSEFLLSCDPAAASYPTPYSDKPSTSWFKFGYPLGYVTDVLQNLEALVWLGKASDPRLANAVQMVLQKQDAQGRWKMEYSYNGKMWYDIEVKGQPSKWVTMRALRLVKQVSAAG